MSQHDLQRVQEDLDTMRTAAGLDLPFDWRDVWVSLWGAAGGIGMSICLALTAHRSRAYSLIFMLPCLIGAIYLRYYYRQSTGRSAVRRKENSLGFIVAGVLVLLVVAYLWFQWQMGLPPRAVGVGIVLGGTVASTVLALSDRGRRGLWGPALAFLGLALALPYLSPHSVAVGAGITVTVGCLLGAAIQTWQLKRQAHA